MSDWTLFSNHGHVLVCLARDPDARLRDVAAAVGITERAVQKIVRDLQQGGMLSVSKQGRRNQYRIHRKIGLRHPLESDSSVGGLVDFVGGGKTAGARVSKSNVKSSVQTPVREIEAEKELEKVSASSSDTPVVDEKALAKEKAADLKEAEIRAAQKREAQKKAAENREVEKKAAEKVEADKLKAEKLEAEKKKAAEQKAAAKKAADQAKAEAKSEIEKQQGSLF